MAVLPYQLAAERALRGEAIDEEAWASLWDHVGARMTGYWVKRGIPLQDAEDIVSGGFWDAYRNRSLYDPTRGAPFTFIDACVRGRVSHYQNNRTAKMRDYRLTSSLEAFLAGRNGAVGEDKTDDGNEEEASDGSLHARIPGVEETVLWREALREAWEALQGGSRSGGSPAGRRLYLQYLKYGEMSAAEAAEVLGVGPDAVKATLHRLRYSVAPRLDWS